ncbi:GNAT family N-acetyltransferase [Oceanibium sediminis]|uniref:GNAT family N-acetyltransferase n=1 Tax=Oceanibium sediminis TaxID=2026339 RepID=UPI000DD458CD|nr:GNAT family N-acetyltransferase [Oceanibium sediminis]
MPKIRPATPKDAPGIAAIRAPLVAETTATFTTVEKTAQTLAEEVNAKSWRVMADGPAVLGFANFHEFRPGPGYRYTAEVSLMLAPQARGAGLAAQLLDAIEAAAKSAGIRTLVAGISGENTRALRFFATHGYVKAGQLPAVGHKFGRDLDLILAQKSL